MGTPQERFRYDLYPERWDGLFFHRPLEPYPPHGERLQRDEAVEIARQGIVDLTRILNEEDLKRREQEQQRGRTISQEPGELRLRDHTLQPLYKLTFEGPFKVVGRCGHPIAFAALDPYPERSGLVVLYAQRAVKEPADRSGAERLRGATRDRVIMSTKDMIEDEVANPNARIKRHEAGDWGDPKGRTWSIVCPKANCRGVETVTNGRSLLLFLQTIVVGDEEMWLGGRSPVRAPRQTRAISSR
jgi:hypothetical protein